ncbi:NAD(P)-binding protein [Lentithecium fluviatile CBS 122367]|uniref:NAD(P)-binding protein n=1 Tax=Lentithecium fluviatile CBS 122367 TaxID=1168545 RepID=A0A6G1JEP1_9PLEO|nr:NAD(P)-binding protein [Lentithecium fluviatile CBS 122367]
MSSPPNNVLVFGAAGAVGRAAAVSASKRGAKVWLAMRDTSKSIPALRETDEKEAGFVRIQADLTDPSSLKAAVSKSGATIAFVYTIHQRPDHMKSAFEVLRDSGITNIILLSSFSVRPSAEEAKNFDFIPRAHAEVELELIASGVKHVAVRPAFFNSNMLWYREGIKKGELELFAPESRFDFIATEDIGAVVGTLLTTPSAWLPENEKNGKSIYLCGPKIMDRKEALGVISRVLGKEISVKGTGEEGFWEQMQHLPRPVAESIFAGTKRNIPPNTEYEEGFWVSAVENVRKYAEREPTSFVDWVKAHKDEFEQ